MSNCKFKVGDKVIVIDTNIDWLHGNKYYGAVGVINKIDHNYDWPYRVTTDAYMNGEGGLWCNVKACVTNSDKIVITHDGKTTKATLYHDNQKTVATARCAPEDTFDFNVGAELAMKRLMEAVNPVIVDGFKVGDRVHFNGHNGTIICIVDSNENPIGVEFDELGVGFHNCKGFTLASGNYGTKGNSRWFDSYELVHGEAPKYYTGKVVCVDLCGRNAGNYTVGKIYEFVDGRLTTDGGTELPTCTEIYTFKDWENFSASKWLEIKE